MPVLFAVTLFTSATLLFMVQPMIGKRILPLLGGSPAAWNTCMVFFQGLLLLGYLYADRLTAKIAPKRQVRVHLAVLFGTLAFFGLSAALSEKHAPIAVVKSLAPQGEAYPMLGVLALLGVAVGLPFLVISTSAPLLQRWFTYTKHPAADDPYFLYAASNAGSLISLLGYPLFIEPTFKLATQAWVWAGGFVVLTGLVYLCGQAAAHPLPPRDPKKLPKGAAAPVPEKVNPRRTLGRPTLARKLRWMGLAFVPSSLMLGVTFHMTTDIASVPLLWVIPLALYLLTFIIAYSKTFEETTWYRPVLVNFAPVMILLLVFVMASSLGGLSTFVLLALHLAAYFFTALLMHSELADMRPDDAEHLTGYFLWISIGGVVGGMFNALVAPVAFPQTWEYPLALVVACLLVPLPDADGPYSPLTEAGLRTRKAVIARVLDFVVPLGMLVLVSYLLILPDEEWFANALGAVAGWMTGAAQWCGLKFGFTGGFLKTLVLHALPCMLCFLCIDRPVRFGLCVAAILGAWAYWTANTGSVMATDRSFFGILRVEQSSERPDVYYYGPPADYVPKEGERPPLFVYRQPIPLHRLTHGTTLHGIQGVAPYGFPVVDNFQAFAPDPWAAVTVTAMSGAYSVKKVTPAGEGEPDIEVDFIAGAYDFRQDPLTYYHRTGPVGDAFRAMRANQRGADVAMIGLGTGSVSCYAEPGQKLTFYEIDPTVIKMVVDTDEYFTYVRDAKKRGAKVDFVLGDARLKLEENKDARYGLLLVDAFSSDSIPVHLLTREAMELYRDRLTEHGLLAIHISNRYIDLEPVVARLAEETGLAARVFSDDDEQAPGKTRSSWILLAKRPEDLGGDVLGEAADYRFGAVAGAYGWVRFNHRWVPLRLLDEVPAWTDDYSDVLRVMRLKEVQKIRRFFGLPTPVKD